MNIKRILLVFSVIALLSFSGCSKHTRLCGDSCSEKCETSVEGQSNNEIKPIITEVDYGSKPLVCSMIGAELAEQKALLKKEIFSQIIEIKEVENGYVFKFEDTGDMLLKLTDYIMIEKACCPFFNFDFSIQPYGKGLELKVSGEKGVKEMLGLFVEEVRE